MSDSRILEALTARDTVALPELADDHRLLGDWVQRGGRTIIAGASGHGKTTLACFFVFAIVAGAEFLGVAGAGVRPALIIDLEQGLRSVKRTLRETGLAERDDVYVVRAPDGLALDSEDGIDFAEIERLIAEIQPVVVLLDPYYKAHRADANEERAVVDLMRKLDGLREQYGFALLLPAHVRKEQTSNGARKLTLDDVSGSGAITRGAEVGLGIERIVHGVARLRVLKDRDGDLAVGEAVDLTYSKDGGFRAKPEEDVEGKALEIAADSDWRTLREFAAELHCGEKKAKAVLDRLVEADYLEVEVGPAGRSTRARCYRLLTTPEALTQSEVVTQSDGQAPLLRHYAAVSMETQRSDVVDGGARATTSPETTPGAVAGEGEAANA